MNRPPLSDNEIGQIRRARYRPSPTHYHYLHLVSLLRGLEAAVARLPTAAGPALDLYCGTQPYRDVLPWRPLWGYDMDLHFGRADVVGGLRLPFRNAAFGVILCTQALYLLDEPATTVAEMRRVLRPGGCAIVTVPRLFRRELALERKFERADLEGLFTDWSEVEVVGLGSPAAGLVYHLGSLGLALSRRFAAARALEPGVALLLNAAGIALDFALAPLRSWQPAQLILSARRSED